ncbi:cyclin-dependent kinase G-2 isoform X1 [Beta vulgaris subsp. vulgaris]|uniref:cyclin-dependent kinase G-2 isoform X1 n=1 Tax=Beta vulgaris subsp. vulgaris TaxID=3555 RepID=UPI0020373014|nr:cyclin-dependent kinase G-2 isoform X1 [Beta vulgaris subsp. vulgaris]XP_057250412.1 cyclin-dependent kinase G-2 isoform X1 [Beta vulgaris subsp. vulgaris]
MASGKVSVLRNEAHSRDSRGVRNRCEGFGCRELDYGVEIRSKSKLGCLEHGGEKGVFDGDFKVKGKEAMEDGIVFSPPQKRRKFSPVVWDVEDTSISFVNREKNIDDDWEPGQIDEEDLSCAPNILTSRWACNNDLEECGWDGEEVKGRSSPESGVTQKGDSDGAGNVLSGSDGDSLMRIGSEDQSWLNNLENCAARESGFDSDEDTKGGVSRGGLRNMPQGCRSVLEYEILGKINEGSYGIVYKARDKKSGEIVAIKKMKMGNEREGFPVCYLREINTLLSLNHPSIVNAREVVVDDSVEGFDNVYMVMEYVEHDIKALMKVRKQPFRQSEVKCLMLQLLEGVKYLHDNWVLHRDLKTSNLLLNNTGELKICDLGMARHYGSPLKPYTALVVTLWYRAPELLLGAKEYSTALDMWSVGCIMAELLTNKPLFDGKTEVEQLSKIFRLLGTPNDKIWPGYSQLPLAKKVNFPHQPYNLLHNKFPRASFTGSPTLSDLGLDLLSRLLHYDPEKRITVEEALNHRWFQEVPLPNSKEFMPTFPAAF